MSSHRREVRPRYGRIAVLSAAVTVSLVAALAGLGVLASGSTDPGLAAGAAAFTHGPGPNADVPTTPTTTPSTAPVSPLTTDVPSADTSAASLTAGESSGSAAATTADETAVPAQSGTGKRIVFDQSLQRVWLVGGDDTARRTYLVSGSITDNLQPGTYSVYSRSRWAVGIADSGVMQYFVRFTQGPTGAAIGFHTIPTSHGVPLQTVDQLGTPTSHGCIRQKTPDAIALWDFAPVGTEVVVVA
jgi:hypothetical protein